MTRGRREGTSNPNVSALVEDLGGVAETGRALGIQKQAVSRWTDPVSNPNGTMSTPRLIEVVAKCQQLGYEYVTYSYIIEGSDLYRRVLRRMPC